MFRIHRGWGRPPGLLIAGALALSLQVAPALAEYQDPIDLPAFKIDSAQQSLLVGVTLAGKRLVAVGERGHILFSDNRGQSWTQAKVDSRMHLNAVTFVDTDTGWVVGEDEAILHTQDGGKSWQRQHDGRDAEQKGPLLDLHFKNNQEGFAIGVFNKLLRTADGGQNWQPWQDHIDNIDEWHLFGIAATSADNLYIASEMGLMFRSQDGGKSFEAVQTDHDGSFHSILARPGDGGADQLVLFGVGGVLYTSTNNGESWNLIDTGIETGLAGGTWLDDGSALIVGADGVVLELDGNLQQVNRHAIDNGMPLSAVALVETQATFVGLGGIQSFTLQELLRLR